MTGNNLDFALNSPDTFFKIQNANGDIVYSRDGSFKNWIIFVDSNGNNVLNADNEPIVNRSEILWSNRCCKNHLQIWKKLGDNTI